MSELLATVQDRSQRSRARRVLVYGTHGIGKSSFAASAPNPLVLDLEDGLGDIEVASSPKISRVADLMGWITELYEKDHDWKTIVIDSVDWLERIIWSYTCEQHNKKAIEDFGFGKGYKYALENWSDVLEGLDALRNDKGMSVLLIAHSQTEKYENPETEPYDRYSPRLHKGASALVQEWCDEGLFACYRVHTTKDRGKSGERHRGIGGEERVLRTRERPFCLAKNRLNMPDEIPLSWDSYSEHWGKTNN